MTRHTRRNRLRLGSPRRGVRVQRDDLRVAVRTHHDATSHCNEASSPWNETLRRLFRLVEDLAILRKHVVLESTSLAEQLTSLQQVHVATDHPPLQQPLADPEPAQVIHLAVDERQHRHRLDVACAVHEVLGKRDEFRLPGGADSAPGI